MNFSCGWGYFHCKLVTTVNQYPTTICRHKTISVRLVFLVIVPSWCIRKHLTVLFVLFFCVDILALALMRDLRACARCSWVVFGSESSDDGVSSQLSVNLRGLFLYQKCCAVVCSTVCGNKCSFSQKKKTKTNLVSSGVSDIFHKLRCETPNPVF